jgi:hypothetical protein
MPINRKRKLRPKTVDCIFLEYAHHSIANRFLVIKSKVSDVYVNTFLESHNVTVSVFCTGKLQGGQDCAF